MNRNPKLEAKTIRRIVHIFITGLCGCHRDGKFPSIKGHSIGCEIRESRADLNRLLFLADSLEQKPSLTRKQWIQARCALEHRPNLCGLKMNKAQMKRLSKPVVLGSYEE